MSEPTMKVTLKSSGDKMIINVADFDAKLHEPQDSKHPAASVDNRTAEQKAADEKKKADEAAKAAAAGTK